ncbi:hypothetical protein OK016_13225 [Vibrio chagasii]|nr:hypothetical protein [Vibrio chagasii]
MFKFQLYVKSGNLMANISIKQLQKCLVTITQHSTLNAARKSFSFKFWLAWHSVNGKQLGYLWLDQQQQPINSRNREDANRFSPGLMRFFTRAWHRCSVPGRLQPWRQLQGWRE